MTSVKKYLNIYLVLGLVVGGIGGYAYYHFIGCQSGTCAITSNPYRMTLYGMLFGVVLFIRKGKDKPQEDQPPIE